MTEIVRADNWKLADFCGKNIRPSWRNIIFLGQKSAAVEEYSHFSPVSYNQCYHHTLGNNFEIRFVLISFPVHIGRLFSSENETQTFGLNMKLFRTFFLT
jgi:hypothetical protein